MCQKWFFYQLKKRRTEKKKDKKELKLKAILFKVKLVFYQVKAELKAETKRKRKGAKNCFFLSD